MAHRTYTVTVAGEARAHAVQDARDGTLEVRDSAAPAAPAVAVAIDAGRGAVRTATIDGRRFDFGVVIRDGVYHLVVDGVPYEVAVEDEAASRLRRAAGGAGGGAAGTTHSGRLVAPIPGRVVRIGVSVGDKVERGQPILVLDAMKLENELAAPKAGTVLALSVKAGQAVEKGQLLVELGD